MANTKRARNTHRTGQFTFSVKPTALAVAVALGLGAGAGSALANPTGPAVVNGQVTVNPAGNLLSITNSPNSIINWQSFSIGANEITRFTQQSAASAVLNRVVGAGGAIDPSVILGALQSNGRVFLLNPSGIVFGAGSQIDVAGLVASSLNLSNADFLGGRLRFTEVPGAGAVVNRGSINAASGGQVYLVGPSVTNSGIITSPQGEVILAAGNSVELVNPGTPNLRVEITAPENEARNLGSIVADAGRVGIYAGLINSSGTIRADGAVATGDGRIVLKATRNVNLDTGSVTTANGPAGGRIEVNAGDTALVAGTVEAKGASGQGGVVHLLGDKVGIYGNARVDVSGETGGGTVLAGGEFQGGTGVTAVEGTAIRNATSSFFGADASIAADAIASGDGGKVIVWSDNTTRSYGAISARGGTASGGGGLVETSGKLTLDVTRGPDLRAPNGLGGTWLIDPNNLELVSGTEITNNTAQPLFSPLADSSRIGVDLINLQLNFGSNVVLTTASQGPGNGTQPGNITVSAPILKSASTIVQGGTIVGPTIGPTSLTLQAHNNIVINPGGSITSTGDPLNVTLSANFFNPGTGTGGVTVNDAILTNGGALSITGSGATSINAPLSSMRTIGAGTGGGGVSISGSTGVSVNAPVVAGPGTVFTSGCGNVAFCVISGAGTVSVGAQVASAGSFAASGANGVAINGPVTVPNNASISASSSGGTVVTSAPLTGGSFSANGATGVSIGNTVTSAGSVNLVSGSGAVNVAGSMTSGSSFAANGFTGVTIGAPVDSGGSISLSSSSGAVNVAGATKSASFFSADGNTGVSINGAITSGSSVELFSTTGPIAVNAAITGGFFDAETYGPGALLTLAAPVTGAGAFLIADNMNIQAQVNAGGGAINVLPATSAQPMNLGSETAGSLSLTQAELSNLVTGGPKLFGNVNTGAITVSAPITVGSSSVAVSSGTSITVNPGASLGTTVPLEMDAPVMAIKGPVSAQSVILQTDSLTLPAGGTVTSAGNIDVVPGSGGLLVNLGVAAHSGVVGTFDLMSSEIDRFVTGPAGTLTIGSTGSDVLTIKGAIPAAGTPTLRLVSGNGISQDVGVGAIINMPGRNLELYTFGDVFLPEHNVVGTLGANAFGSNFTFTSAPGQKLTIGTFGGGSTQISGTATITADGFDVAASTFFGDLTVMPHAASVRLDLGGADAAGVLGISQTDLDNISANSLTLKADQADITGTSVNVANVGTLVLAPLTSGRALNIVGGPKDPANLEFQPSEIGLVSVNSFVLGDNTTGPVTVNVATTIPSGVGTFGLRSGDTVTGITLNTNDSLSLLADGSLAFFGDTMNVNASVTSINGNITIAPNTPGRPIDLGTKTGGTLGLTAGEVGQLFATNGTLFIGNSSAGDLTVSNPVTVSGAITLITDNPIIGAAVTSGAGNSIDVYPFTQFLGISLGGAGTANTVYLNNAEIDQFRPGSGVLRIGDMNNTGNIALAGQITNPGTLGLTTLSLVTNVGGITQPFGAGFRISVQNLAARARNDVSLPGDNLTPTIALRSTNGNVSFTNAGTGPLTVSQLDTGFVDMGVYGVSAPGIVTLRTNEIAITSNLQSSNGTVTLAPFTAGSPVTLGTKPGGGTLGLTETELNSIFAFALNVGDTTTGNVSVTAPVSIGGFSNLNVVTQPASSFTVGVMSPLTVPGNITVSTGSVTTSSPMSSTFGSISLSANAITFGSGAGVSANSGSISLLADAMTFSLGATVSANPSFGTISLAPLNPNTPVNLGGPDGGASAVLGLDSTDIGNLSAAAIAIGNSSTASIATTTAPTHFAAPSVTLTTKAGGPIIVGAGAALDNTGNLTLNGGGNATITLGDTVASTGGALSVSTGSGGSITDNATLTSLGSLSLFAAGAGTITANGTLTSTSGALALTTGIGGTITANGALSAAGDTTLTADNIMIPGGSVSGANVTVSTANSSLAVDLGAASSPTPGAFLLDQAALNRISTAGTFTLNAGSGTGGTINVNGPGPVAFANSANLALNAGTLNVSGALSAPGNITLRANAMDIQNSVTTSGVGSVISVAPRSFTTMRLGTNTGTGLLLADAEIDRFIVPNGVLRLGDTGFASQVSVEGLITINPASVGAFTLAADGNGITQTAGSTITASNLRLQTTGQINLTEANAVGTLAGGNSFSTYAFTNAGLLSVGGTVDGVAGLQGGTLILRSDDIALTGPGIISNSNVTLAPRLAGAAMNLGASPGGVFGVDAAELTQISGNTLTFGISASASQPTGAVVVSAPMQRTGTFQTLNIATGPTQTVDVNAALSSPFGVQIDAGTINVSQPVSSSSGSVILTARAPATLNINAPVTAGSSVGLNSDATNINAAVTANQSSGSVFIAPVTPNRLISLGVESSGALSLTQAEFALISAPNISIGSSSAGAISISAPLDLNVNQLSLSSGGAILQGIASPIRLTRVNSTGQRIGNLDVRSFGTGSANAAILLPAANEVPSSLIFDTAGTNNDFDFVNALPMKVQAVFNQGVTGKVRINSAPFVPLPVVPVPPEAPEAGPASNFQAQLISAIDQIADINDALDVYGAEDRKKSEDEKKKQQVCR